ncbi:hypothetical protein DM794_01485 [Paenarthrobacter ureafaciens]|uniref:Uncharacterized protein n=1 Tax=Paenarthrobacter ureafaciens TaxID=37931 RepID=A0AAX3EL57_PAEUR|nr:MULTISPECIES: hypothetical protein [Paenarthrobacter]AMB39612.1 hypothetical protein AUT26_04850 [Arthrobacter sp. ATCC 21022]NKR12522.1 hypothetical protein [Arthrobacter sp. M5]NKR17053.1 hypothetical protein [Arthrobacter sp. M6]OEH61232.1 hypothetical protein A5N13_17250 [Arthrobacter sp. D4]OEH61678.1 hypothetical protein A5N17_13465 [Arthrobacter sp. D2]
MSGEPNEQKRAPAEPQQPTEPAGVEPPHSEPGSGDFTTEVDPTFVPDESGESPEEKRAREHPEATGS